MHNARIFRCARYVCFLGFLFLRLVLIIARLCDISHNGVRNIAPLLNANGWAINAEAKISIPFGNTLTEQAQYPIMKLKDPFQKKGLSKGSKWSIAIAAIVLSIAIAVLVCYLVGVRVCFCIQ